MLPIIVACDKDDQPESDTTGESSSISTSALDKYNVSDDLGEMDLGGRQVIIGSIDRGFFKGEVTVDGFLGETINDAVYARQMAVQERLNGEIVS